MTSHTTHAVPPPSYEGDDKAATMTLLLVGQSIHADAMDAPALYELNRGVANLGHATTTVELTRVERRVHAAEPDADADAEPDAEAAVGAAAEEDGDEKKKAAAGTGNGGEASSSASASASAPRIKVRRRHVMDLVHPTGKGGTMTSVGERVAGTPQFYARPVTRQTHQGVYGLKSGGHKRGRHWKVLPVVVGGKRDGNGEYSATRFEDKGTSTPPLLEARRRAEDDGKGGALLEWTMDGEALALERWDVEGERYELSTARAVEGTVLDVLVAMWCCRLWEAAAERQPQVHDGSEKFRRAMHLAGSARRVNQLDPTPGLGGF